MNADASNLNPALLRIDVTSFPTDSREVKAGDLFFAFSQPEFENNCFNGDFLDATEFVPSAFGNGAAAAVVRSDRHDEHHEKLEEFSDRIIFADDVIASFQNLAKNVCRVWNKPVIAVVGSAGKTTAKDFTSHILSASGRKVLKTEKSFNNGLGHPMTVLKLAADDSYDVAVLEMGMSTPNREIARLCEISPPDLAVVLNILPVHIEYLGSIENIAKAKSEVVENLKPSGTAILNADDFRVMEMKNLHSGKTITYGIENEADIMALGVTMKRFEETHFTLKTRTGEEEVVFQHSGRHNVLNALAASAVGYSFGMTALEIANALSTVKPPSQRGEILHFQKGFTIINDSYNSNPAALLKMVGTLTEGAGKSKRKIVVAGEMLELGDKEKEIHEQTGKELAASDIDYLIGVRGLAQNLVESALKMGLENGRFFSSSEEAGEFLIDELKENDVVLVKGSRGVRTEKVIEKIIQKFDRKP